MARQGHVDGGEVDRAVLLPQPRRPSLRLEC